LGYKLTPNSVFAPGPVLSAYPIKRRRAVAAAPAELGRPLRPYASVHRRYFDFTKFESLGLSFMAAFSTAFVNITSTVGFDASESYFGAAVNFFRWLLQNEEYLQPFIVALRTEYRQSESKQWESVLSGWRAHVISRSDIRNSRKHNLIKTLNILIKKMFGFGVIPKLFLESAPSALRPCRPTKTLAEISPRGREEVGQEVINTILSKTSEKAIDLQMKRDFLTTLANANQRILGTPAKHAQELMRINANRLAAIRSCAEKDFTKWVDVWNKGQEAVGRCDLSFEEIVQRLTTRKEVFPEHDDRISLSRLLRYFVSHPNHKGRIFDSDALPKPVSREVSRHGGIQFVQAYLFPHPDLTTAVITLILCDTGANISVALELGLDCLQSSPDPTHRIIAGHKLRGAGKLIINELPIKDRFHEVSTIQAVTTYQQISKIIRELASKEASKLLFLQVARISGVKGVGFTWAKWFRSFVTRHPEISDLPIQSKMIRPSVLMQAEYDKESGIFGAAATADHTSVRTTNSYVFRYPNKMVWERMIREFQALFQAVSIYSIKRAAERLGLTTRQVKKLFGEACRTGLGVACLNPRGGVQPGSIKGEICTQLQNCCSCPNRIVVATVENLKDLIIWHQHLENNRREWELSRPEKWAKDWLPWLVFTRVVIEQASRGRTAAQFSAAKRVAESQLRNGNVNLPCLW